ncbi:MAG: FAD-dependent oxidoreductase [Candidatus Eisenbacteria bacterium]|uniref:FAD-dependent oxidoreductase n=1 Tax=Eiseniibacteriota bacterium TaxID=2212470 RepID=A0A948RW65_UNCEI|nr:FAD-dependent oxidoreductase [Candidatus Eisenbacteria bacterium]MBU1948778.1 FAD-dependent oxidoreductase [Candidatus Eisenbacteria bacterium]MBU2691611.1 FAD-dependent oxidoreductase [Candidatus Eisenbacteria bacterium]
MKSSNELQTCIIVGAGMAGLLAAKTLQSEGIETLVLDKGRGLGGRLATRRIENGVFDHGAQFLKTSNKRFQDVVRELLIKKVAGEWFNGTLGFPDITNLQGRPHYIGLTGMTGIAKYLAQDLTIHKQVRITSIKQKGSVWKLLTDKGTSYKAASVLMTPPIPQTLSLLDPAILSAGANNRELLESIVYKPNIAVMALLNGPSALPVPGVLRLEDGPLSWMADNNRKGISPKGTALTLHASHDFSVSNWQMGDGEIARHLLTTAGTWIGSEIINVQVHRWLYSRVANPLQAKNLVLQQVPILLLAGDAFGGGDLEGAALSGLSAADVLLNWFDELGYRRRIGDLGVAGN